MNKIDQRNSFEDEPFAYRVGKDGTVFISWQGRQATILRGKAAARFLSRIAGLDGAALQLELAKVTGNFKRGNERQAKQHAEEG